MKKIRKSVKICENLWLVLFFVLLFCRLLFADAYIFGHLDKNKITIGDRVKLTIVIEYRYDIKFSSFTFEENLKSFEIKDYKVSKEKKKYFIFGRYIKKYEYLLSTFTTGIYEIPPFTINFTTTDGKIAQSQTQSLKIEVTSLLDKESASDIRDIKPPVNIKHSLIFYIFIFGAPLFLLVVYFFHNYFNKKNIAQIIDEIVDPYKYAIDELAKLEISGMLSSGKIKEFFTVLTQIVRIYLSKIFVVNITDMTTFESIKALREKNADRKFLIKLRDFFDCSDLVKFAKYIPDEKEIISNLENAKDIIEMVKPIPKITEEQKNGVQQ